MKPARTKKELETSPGIREQNRHKIAVPQPFGQRPQLRAMQTLGAKHGRGVDVKAR